jgi:peroxiredoxin
MVRPMIKPGDTLPDATLTESTAFGDSCPMPPQKLSAADLAKGKRIVIFGLPGAFTPTCSGRHVPGYLEQLDALRARGGRRGLVRVGQRRLRHGGLGPRARRHRQDPHAR